MPFRDALISKPLRPTLPIKPKGRTSCYMFFNNVQRSEMRIKYPNLRLCDTSKLVAEKWHKMSEQQYQQQEYHQPEYHQQEYHQQNEHPLDRAYRYLGDCIIFGKVRADSYFRRIVNWMYQLD